MNNRYTKASTKNKPKEQVILSEGRRGRALKFENVIEWLCLSGIVSQVYQVEQIKKPLETYHPDYAIKLSAKNFSFEDRKKTVPLYAAFCI